MEEIDWQLFLRLVFPIMVGFLFFFLSWYKVLLKHLLHFCAIIFFSLLQSSCYKLYVYFRKICYTTNTQMSFLKKREESFYKSCGTQMEEAFFWRHTKRCSTGTLQFTQCSSSSTTSRFTSLFSLILSKDRWKCLHFSLTTVRLSWTITPSLKLEIIFLRVTSYKAHFMQFST